MTAGPGAEKAWSNKPDSSKKPGAYPRPEESEAATVFLFILKMNFNVNINAGQFSTLPTKAAPYGIFPQHIRRGGTSAFRFPGYCPSRDPGEARRTRTCREGSSLPLPHPGRAHASLLRPLFSVHNGQAAEHYADTSSPLHGNVQYNQMNAQCFRLYNTTVLCDKKYFYGFFPAKASGKPQKRTMELCWRMP